MLIDTSEYPHYSSDEDIYLVLIALDKAGYQDVFFEQILRSLKDWWLVSELNRALDAMEERGIIGQSEHKTRVWLNQ